MELAQQRYPLFVGSNRLREPQAAPFQLGNQIPQVRQTSFKRGGLA